LLGLLNGTVTGLIMTAVGTTLLMRWDSWSKSLSFVVGKELSKGNCF
jgi:hypothetical protein